MPTGFYPRKPLAERLIEKVKKSAGCWEWIGAVGTHGYGRMGHGGKTFQAHRLSWIVFKGPLATEDWVLHRCDNRRCVNPAHLFLGDRIANVRDCVQKRRHIYGERSKLSRLSASDVREIRALYATKKFTQDRLAKRFGVDQTTIHHVVRGKTWKEAV